jgi:hypothetical protein
MSNITEQIKEELQQAREICDVSGTGSQECTEAWTAVEQLEQEAAKPSPDKPKNSLEVYCDDNPEAAECRLYED